MKTEPIKGSIRLVRDESIFGNSPVYTEWWEVFDGKKWLGKIWTQKKLNAILNELGFEQYTG